jgi:2-keto-4-pentenoate hydratase/2-oxohepta-3-ene-1,7-dioic acid hydratase in catechol pathway
MVDGDVTYVHTSQSLEEVLAAGLSSFEPEQQRRRQTRDLAFDAPLRPPVVFCAGQNYRDHLDEKAPVKSRDLEFFLKAGQTIAAPGDPCVLDPRVTKKLDYETELGIVVGKPGRHILPEDALEHVAGYVVVNDVTARDRQVVIHEDGTTGMSLGPGKNFDGSTRLGDFITSADEAGDPGDLALATRVNGELRQQNTTASMLTDVPHIIAWVSRLLTLAPGTVIATGTPGGTGWGMDPELGGTGRTPPNCEPARYLAVGDTVVSAVGTLAELQFTVVGHE